jgi:hypothetical protein
MRISLRRRNSSFGAILQRTIHRLTRFAAGYSEKSATSFSSVRIAAREERSRRSLLAWLGFTSLTKSELSSHLRWVPVLDVRGWCYGLNVAITALQFAAALNVKVPV